MPGIICLQEVFRETDKLDCGANRVFFNAPKMLGALRAPAIVLKNDVAKTAKAVGGESRWIEVIINNTPKIIISAHLSTQATPTRAVHSNTGRVRHVLGEVSEARKANVTTQKASEWDLRSRITIRRQETRKEGLSS